MCILIFLVLQLVPSQKSPSTWAFGYSEVNLFRGSPLGRVLYGTCPLYLIGPFGRLGSLGPLFVISTGTSVIKHFNDLMENASWNSFTSFSDERLKSLQYKIPESVLAAKSGNALKRELTEESYDKTENALKKLKTENSNFKFAGNKIQFDFNEEILNQISKIRRASKSNDKDISPAGWDTVKPIRRVGIGYR
ncbi:hypothetical protein KUTeg_013153 [Tegillarca granosa]|uniref:Uncharacterized protein n=1 Tax=Tegillarca granosa TaxID=220873 RepID=A0ABQ9ET92_TEGGR|nr:hypothetical protein KUTeg_013153 [Tegillarca granosa]